MKNKVYILLLLIFLLFSCSKNQKTNIHLNYYTKGNHFLTNRQFFETKHNLCLASYGINQDVTMYTPPRYAIHQFEVFYYSVEKLDINEARKKLINYSQEYLKEINNDEDLKSVLYKHPFTNEELFFGMSFYDQNGKRLKDDYITTCAVAQDIIYYNTEYSDGSFDRIHEEPYEKALEIVNNNITPDIPKKQKSTRIYIPDFSEAEEVGPSIYKISPKVEVKQNEIDQ